MRRHRLLRLALAFASVLCLLIAQDTGIVRAAGPPGWLGIAMESTAAGGVRVTRVLRGSPASSAGLKVGDEILKVDGREVKAPRDVVARVGSHDAGDHVSVEFTRKPKAKGASPKAKRTVSIVLAPRPTRDEMARREHVGTYAPAWKSVTPATPTSPASLSEVSGKVVVIEFWATWCGPCRATSPVLSDWQDRMGARGLRVVGITTDDAGDAAAHARREGFTYSVVSDPKGETSVEYGVSAIPTLFLVDRAGKIRDVVLGFDRGALARVEREIGELLKEPAKGS